MRPAVSDKCVFCVFPARLLIFSWLCLYQEFFRTAQFIHSDIFGQGNVAFPLFFMLF